MANQGAFPERPPSRATTPLAGELLDGKYRIERVLAEGGCGVVVLATQVQLDRLVAIKYLRPHMLGHAHVVALFEREARLAAKLRSEHVVRVHDVGVHPVIGPYMVMEFLEGVDLEELLVRGPLRVDEAVEYVLQACEALAEAHALDIVHRDLKPANLFLARGTGGHGVVKVIDFGIAKTASGKDDGAGTLGYMAPEQLAGGRVDRRADVWALGVVLYELLTGHMAWPDGSAFEQIEAIRKGPPPSLLAARPDLPAALEPIVRTCLQSDPAARYGDVTALAEALRAAAPARSAPSITASNPRFTSVPAISSDARTEVPRPRLGAPGKAFALGALLAAGLAFALPSRVAHEDADVLALEPPPAPADLAREPMIVTSKFLQVDELAAGEVRPVRQTMPGAAVRSTKGTSNRDRRRLFGQGRM